MVDSWIKSVVIGRIATVICLALTSLLEIKGYKMVPEDQTIIVDIIKYLLLAWGTGTGLASKVRERKKASTTIVPLGEGGIK